MPDGATITVTAARDEGIALGRAPVRVRGETVAIVNGSDASAPAVVALARALEVAAETAADRHDIAREALERYRELNLLYRVGASIGGALDPDTITDAVLAEAVRVVRAQAALLVPLPGTATPAAQRGEPERVASLEGASGPLAESVARTGRADISAPEDGDGFGSILAVAVRGPDGVLGTIVLGRLYGRPPFTAGDEKLVIALADQAAMALERSSLHLADATRQRMEQELVVARRIQLGLLPPSLPQPPGWSVAGLYEPAREVGGDIYDAFRLPESDALSLLVADVTGKGVPAALVMATARATLRSEACAGRSPGDVLDATNRALLVGHASPLFLSALHGVLDVGSGALRYASAGHEPPVLLRASGETRLLDAGGVVLGAYADIGVREELVTLEPGDAVVLYTDGITEARDGAGAMYGEERLLALLDGVRGAPAHAVVEAVRADVAAFSAGTPPYDDVTLLVVARDAA